MHPFKSIVRIHSLHHCKTSKIMIRNNQTTKSIKIQTFLFITKWASSRFQLTDLQLPNSTSRDTDNEMETWASDFLRKKGVRDSLECRQEWLPTRFSPLPPFVDFDVLIFFFSPFRFDFYSNKRVKKGYWIFHGYWNQVCVINLTLVNVSFQIH